MTKINAEAWMGNPFEAIGKDWFLLTAGTGESCNPMTCSWGAMGVLWNKPALTCYVRHSRHTYGFMEDGETFTLSFFGQEQRQALGFCGSHSGRSCDKIAESGLTKKVLEDGAVTYEEAKLVLVCKKRFAADLDPANMPEDVRTQFYADNDLHRMYIGEVVAMYI